MPGFETLKTWTDGGLSAISAKEQVMLAIDLMPEQTAAVFRITGKYLSRLELTANEILATVQGIMAKKAMGVRQHDPL